MKKTLLLSAFVVIAFYGHTQSVKSSAQLVQFGLTFGVNFNNIQGNGIKNSYEPGFIAGGFSRIALSKKWNIQPEVLFNFSNSKKADNFIEFYNTNGSPFADTKIRVDYVSIPVLLGYKVTRILTLQAGPQYSFLVYDDENLLEANKASAFKSSDVGIVAGASLKFDNVNFFGRYYSGLANVNNIDDRYKWRNRQVDLGLNIILF